MLGRSSATALMVFLLWTGPLGAADFNVRVGSQGWIIRKPVKSMKELKFQDIVRQQTDFSCGAAALATLLKYYYNQADLSEEEVVQWLLLHCDQEAIRQRGFSLLDLKRYALNLGYRAEGYRVEPDQLAKITIPTIILLNIKGYSHFVVLKGVRKGLAYIADPALGKRTIALKDLVESWNGLVFAVFGKDTNADYDLFDGPPTIDRKQVWRLSDLMMRNLFINSSEFKR